jgi:glycosyltransferase involved in cell wall biosynthesis
MNSRTSVCHFTSVHPPGDTRIFVKECRSLAAAGFEVHLVVANAESTTRDGVKIIGVHVPSSRIARMLFGAGHVVRAALAVNADIYHFHDPELLRYARRLKRAGKRVVYDSHEDLPRQIAHKHYIPSWLKPLAARCAEWLENRWVRHCDAVVTATAFIRDRFARFHPRAVDVCNYPSLDELPAPDFNATRERAACYIGSITAVRGIREKIRMMDGASFRLLLGGPFAPPALLEEMKAQPGWKNVEYAGPLSRAQVVDMLRRSAVGLVTMHNSPNYAEALPVKMFEYMAAGIPVVTNGIPLWKKIAEENHCGVAVDIEDTGAFRSAVEALLNDPQRCMELGKNGRRAVEEKFNWTVEERKLIALYRDLAGHD